MDGHDQSSPMRAVFQSINESAPASSAPPTVRGRPYTPLPAALFPVVLRDLIREGARALGCDAAQIALPALAACSAAIGNSRRIQLKASWYEPAVLWTVVVLPSGTGKSPAMDLALEPIRAAQGEAVKSWRDKMTEHAAARAEWEGRKKHLRGAEPIAPVCDRLTVKETTVEALGPLLQEAVRGLLCERDELSGWLKGFNQYKAKGGADEAHWLTMHGARALTVDRKTGEHKLIFVPRAFVAITGTIQPGVLRGALTAEHRESGLAARMLLAMPPVQPRRWSEAVVNVNTQGAYAAMLGALRALPMAGDASDPQPLDVPLTAGAKALFVKFVNDHGAEQESHSGDLAAAWAKLEGYAARLALIVHMVRVVSEGADADAVDKVSMNVGIHLARWFGGEAERVYAMLGGDAGSDELQSLWAWIIERGGRTTARELTRTRRKFSAPGAARDALNRLAHGGYGRWIFPTPGERGGKPTEVFEAAEALTIPPRIDPADSADVDDTLGGGGENEGIGIVSGVSASESGGIVGADEGEVEVEL